MGMCAGWADLDILIGKQICFMEFKTPKGKLTPAQKAFQAHCQESGIPHAVPRSMEEAKEIFNQWLQSL
jgi:hypothetical protein